MGAQWKQAGREANAAKRGALFGKLVKEILVAAKMGDPMPENNSRLRVAVEAARKASVPRDTIDRAIKRGSGQTGESVQIDLVTYEGFAPAKVPVIVECLTDNKNRTASDIRLLFKKAHLGGIGSVAWMFDRVGVVEGHHADKGFDLEGVAIEAGADNVEALPSEEGTSARFTCNPVTLDTVSHYLSDNKWSVTIAEMSYLAKNFVELQPDQQKEVAEFLNEVDEHDDVHRVYAAIH